VAAQLAACRARRPLPRAWQEPPRSGGISACERLDGPILDRALSTGLRARQSVRCLGTGTALDPQAPAGAGQPARPRPGLSSRTGTGWGPRLIASELGMAHATVSRCLQRRGMSRAPRPPREEVRRFEWPCPGDLIKNDTKRFARFSRPGHAVTGDRATTGAEKRERLGYEIAHSAIDDHSRLVYTEIHHDEKADTVLGFTARRSRSSKTTGSRSGVGRPTTPGPTPKQQVRRVAEGKGQFGIARSRRGCPSATARSSAISRRSSANGASGSATSGSATAQAAALPHWLQHYNNDRNHSERQPAAHRRVRNQPRQNT
jgi:hypothetical protein